jgi:hypothetical protein
MPMRPPTYTEQVFDPPLWSPEQPARPPMAMPATLQPYAPRPDFQGAVMDPEAIDPRRYGMDRSPMQRRLTRLLMALFGPGGRAASTVAAAPSVPAGPGARTFASEGQPSRSG